jgi:hypothetical protein
MTWDAQNNVLNVETNILVTTADYLQIKMVTPAWVTNPTAVLMFADVLIEVA